MHTNTPLQNKIKNKIQELTYRAQNYQAKQMWNDHNNCTSQINILKWVLTLTD